MQGRGHLPPVCSSPHKGAPLRSAIPLDPRTRGQRREQPDLMEVAAARPSLLMAWTSPSHHPKVRQGIKPPYVVLTFHVLKVFEEMQLCVAIEPCNAISSNAY
ncbi:hypothetical protein EJB05_30890 [Eragrostis curvula]|uniref:Uncharacterized protein n=1 Tax=Eragrostis curvula TaxID=38414 RepID=A0A5J9UC56_9POAL|nr:hypothetical protein EJB05_30890 [Eragrostis curvula]